MENTTLQITKKKRGKILPPPLIPYTYQVPIIKKMIDRINEGKNGLIIQPTATGKSVESAFVARACILLHEKRGLYLYDENEGLSQARNKFEEIFNKNEILCANFFGYGKDQHVEKADMVFASFQSLNNQHGKSYLKFDPKHFDFVIVNEAHHGQALTYKEVITYFLCPRIGMTATPIRMDGRDILEIFDEILYEMSLEEAIVNGWVAQIEYHMMSHGLSTQKLKKICNDVLEEGKRISIKQLNETIFVELLDDEVKKEIYRYAFPEEGESRQTLIFCEGIEHTNHFLTQLLKDGMSAECVHSHRTDNQNRKSMENFRHGKTQFLLSIDKLNEDIDVPEVELGVFLRATDSWTVFIQQMGRLLRKTKTKSKAIIIDFVANVQRIILIQNMLEKVSKFTGGIPLDKTPLYVSGEGFDFRFTDEMIDITKVLESIRKGLYSTWQEASIAAQDLGIKSYREYRLRFREDMRLPNVNSVSKFQGFPGWKKFLGHKIAPEGWKVIDFLSSDVKLGLGIRLNLNKFLKPYRKRKPEFFGLYWTTRGYREHIHPDLVKNVLDKFSPSKPLPGWNSANGLLQKLGKRDSKHRSILNDIVKGLSSKIKKENIRIFHVHGHEVKHYSPSLSEIIIHSLRLLSEKSKSYKKN